jgi:catechol 2,3-dioxygenase-like lactoylglutathione lyase family enzyme
MQTVFAHLILDVKSIEQSIAFYRDRLGFAVRQKEEYDGHHLAYISADDFEILLLEQPVEDQAPALARGAGVVLNFRVSNLRTFAQALKRQRVKVLRDIDDPPFGERTILVTDPDGYAILLSEPVGTYH